MGIKKVESHEFFMIENGWRPIYSLKTVLIGILTIGLTFTSIGMYLLTQYSKVQEFSLDYTNCNNCDILIMNNSVENCICEIEFMLTESMFPNVSLYYGLTNYHQNHRRYASSWDGDQLIGIISRNLPYLECTPYDIKNGSVVFPCGIIANSMFNDTITLHYLNDEINDWETINLIRTGIAFPFEKGSRYRNPSNLKEIAKETIPPPNWNKTIFELDPDNPENNGLLNEDFIVWMRTAAFSNFKKLYRRIDHTTYPFESGIPNEYRYKAVIKYRYPVTKFKGTKRIVLSNATWIGGKNILFLALGYTIVGIICLILPIVLMIIHVKYTVVFEDEITPDTPYFDKCVM